RSARLVRALSPCPGTFSGCLTRQSGLFWESQGKIPLPRTTIINYFVTKTTTRGVIRVAALSKFMRQTNILGLIPACLAVALLIGAARVTVAAPANDHIVVMISVDGLAAYYLDDPRADVPTLRMLAKEGARAESMKAVTPTVTWPNHTTLVT